MSKPLAWSFTSLDTFGNCPWQFFETKVSKKYPYEVNTPEAIEGRRVHKAFENRQATRDPLPPDLVIHEEFMKKLEDKPGHFFTERQVAFDKQQRPCAYFGPGVWWRGVIDYGKVDGPNATVVDYKTGKKKEKWRQLALAALHTFAVYPDVMLVNSQFYWTQDQTISKKIYGRDEINLLWAEMIPDLMAYVTAFKTDSFPPKPSGLCHGWCPVIDCEHWKPKRKK